MCSSFVETAINNVDLDRSKLNSASTEGITPRENQGSSETTEQSFSTSLKQSEISCNASSKSSAAPDIVEGNTTIAAVTCTRDIEVDRPSPASTEIQATANDIDGPTVLITANAESNTQGFAEDPSNLELANETTIPQTEEDLPLIDADSQSEDTGRPENNHGGRDNDFGKHTFQ